MNNRVKISRSHHYVPQFHLKGFLRQEKDSFFIFDKENEKIRETNTRDVLFENHRNTLFLPNGRKDDFLELLYGVIEKKTAPIFEKIRENKTIVGLSDNEKLVLNFYLSSLYWRLPASDSLSDRIRETQGLGGVGSRLLHSDGSFASKEEVDKLMSYDGMKKMYRMLLPFEVFRNSDNLTKQISQWCSLSNDPGYFMISDNPIIIRKDAGGLDDMDEFVVPISKDVLLINNSSIPRVLSEKFFIQVGLIMLHQAKRFVCCHDKEFLEQIVKFYKDVYKFYDKIDEIKSEFFDMLDTGGD